MFALILVAFARTTPVHAATAPSWRIAGTASTPIRVPVVQRLVDRGPDGRAAALELDALVPVDGEIPWGAALPVLEGKGRGKREWTRIADVEQTSFFTAEGGTWRLAPGDTVRAIRIRFGFDGEVIASTGIDGPWRLRFVTIPDASVSDESGTTHYEALTAALKAADFGFLPWRQAELRMVEHAGRTIRLLLVADALRTGDVDVELSALQTTQPANTPSFRGPGSWPPRDTFAADVPEPARVARTDSARVAPKLAAPPTPAGLRGAVHVGASPQPLIPLRAWKDAHSGWGLASQHERLRLRKGANRIPLQIELSEFAADAPEDGQFFFVIRSLPGRHVLVASRANP